MDDASGKFALVTLRADQVRVHHKKTKHEYRFRVSGHPPEVGLCTFHPNPAAQVNPADYRDDAKTAAEWFVSKGGASHAPALGTRPTSGWLSA
jgi:hypothetical protein